MPRKKSRKKLRKPHRRLFFSTRRRHRKGKDFNVVKKIINDFINLIKTNAKFSINSLNEDQKTTIMSLSGVKQFPMRVKCATMAWHTATSALEGKND